MPAHWLMARLGKRVLRPGGLEATALASPARRSRGGRRRYRVRTGLGPHSHSDFARGPRTYAGVERDERAAQYAESSLARAGVNHARVLRGDAASVPRPAGAANLVIGEAMLSMQIAANKRAIMREAWRLLRPGGRYVIHELAVTRDALDLAVVQRIQRDLSSVIHVGVRIGTVQHLAHPWRRPQAEGRSRHVSDRSPPLRSRAHRAEEGSRRGTARAPCHVTPRR
jgi:precorrin-6B methylase 2